jgi:hypothetical protein
MNLRNLMISLGLIVYREFLDSKEVNFKILDGKVFLYHLRIYVIILKPL